MANDTGSEVLERLSGTRAELARQLWATARKVTGPEAWEQLRELARFRADIEGLDFAMANYPREDSAPSQASADAPPSER